MSTLASLSLNPDSTSVAHALAWLDQIAARRDWPPRTVFALQLSMDEALTNTVMHGFASSAPADASITLTLAEDSAFVILEIIDNGSKFDPTAKTPDPLAASLDDAMPGGHGLRLMRHYLHDIQHTYSDGRNRLRLVASLNPS